MKKVLDKLVLWLAPPLYLLLSTLLFWSCRVREYGRHNYESCQNEPLIGSVWHYSVFLAINGMKGGDWVAMVSGSKDAELIARLLGICGFATVRGSRRKGGLKAIKEMVRYVVERRFNAAIIADGSQGPPRVVQAGVILLASRTGAPIIPTAWGLSRYKAFGSWDHTVIPLPFSRIALCYGEPLRVPKRLKAAELEEYRLLLEERLNAVYKEAWGHFGRNSHYDDR